MPSTQSYSSDEDGAGEEEEEEENGNHLSEEILQKVFDSYGLRGEVSGQDDKTRTAILGVFKKGQSSCLICISSIK